MKNQFKKYMENSLTVYKEQMEIERKFSNKLKEVSLSYQQFLFLYLIDKSFKENEVATSVIIRDYMGVARSAISRLSGRLEDLGLIKKIINAKFTIFELTSKGQNVFLKGIDLISEE